MDAAYGTDSRVSGGQDANERKWMVESVEN